MFRAEDRPSLIKIYKEINNNNKKIEGHIKRKTQTKQKDEKLLVFTLNQVKQGRRSCIVVPHSRKEDEEGRRQEDTKREG